MIPVNIQDDGSYFLDRRITPPRRARSILSRPRLNQLACGILRRLLTVVSAPPGYGKTTLALAWSDELTGAGANVGWLSLDAADNDAAQLLFHMAAALGRTGIPGLLIPTDLLAPRSMADPLRLAEKLLSAVARHTGDVVLFLDDCHCVVDADALGLILLFYRLAPANLHLVLLSRGELPPALLSQLALGDLVQIGSGVLSFDAAETAQLASKLRGDVFTPAELSALQIRTAGWPAALRASLLSVGNLPSAASGLRIPTTTRPIAALIEDLLDNLPPALVDSMARVAVVERFNVCLVQALTERADAQALLDDILQRQLFVSACDAEQRWFSFHSLFRDQLLRRLTTLGGADVGELHRRAADWFASRGLWEGAVAQALSAGDHAKAMLWIERCAMQLLQAGDLVTLLSWMGQLRSQAIACPLRLKLAVAWAHAYAMHTSECARILADVESALQQEAGTDLLELQAEILALHAILKNLLDDDEGAVDYAERCLAQAPRDARVRNIAINVQCTSYLRRARWKEFYSLPPVTDDTDDGRISTRNLLNHCCRLSYLGMAAHSRGRLDQAAAELQRAMVCGGAKLQVSGVVVPCNRSAWVLPTGILAEVRYQQGRLSEADQLLGTCLALVPLVAPGHFPAPAYLTAIRLAHQRGDRVRVASLLDEFDALGESRSWPRLQAQSLLERLRLSLLAGSDAEAAGCRVKLHQVLHGLRRDLRAAQLAQYAFLGDVWFETRYGNPASLIDTLRRRAAVAMGLELTLEAARLYASLAFALLRCGDEAGSDDAMGLACEVAAAAGAQRVLFDLPVAAHEVVGRLEATRPLLAAGSDTDLFVARLIDQHAARPELVREAIIPVGAVEHLSGREHHVLKLVAQGQRNKEIARQLGVAPSTVKYHLRSVFSKLGVTNRAQAVALAREASPGSRRA